MSTSENNSVCRIARPNTCTQQATIRMSCLPPNQYRRRVWQDLDFTLLPPMSLATAITFVTTTDSLSRRSVQAPRFSRQCPPMFQLQTGLHPNGQNRTRCPSSHRIPRLPRVARPCLTAVVQKSLQWSPSQRIHISRILFKNCVPAILSDKLLLSSSKQP
jgi:hypothetical protein